MPSKTNNAILATRAKSIIYQQAKAQGLPVAWDMKAAQIQEILDRPKRQAVAQTKIASIFKMSKAKSQLSDLKALKKVNKYQTTTMLLDQFKRIRPNIDAPADKNHLIHFLNNDGSTLRTYHLNSHQVSIDELYVTAQNEYTSGADIDLHILPTTMVTLEWIEDPKQSRSSRKNFFRYMTKADYMLDQFQVYPESPNGLPQASEIPCFLYALEQAGVSKVVVNKIKQIMFHSGVTTNLFKKISEMFKLRLSVRPYKDNNGVKSYNINNYGPHSKNIIHLGVTPKHVFAMKQTNITLTSLNNPEIVKQEGSTEFVLHNGRVTYNSTRIKYLDSFEVISHLYHNRDKLLIPITQSNVPKLLNNEYQKVDSLCEEDFNDDTFKEIGRVDGKMKFGKSPFNQVMNKYKKQYEEIINFNVIYFDFETLVTKQGEHVAYCISFKIQKYKFRKLHSTGETQHFYGFDCAQRFLVAIPEKSHNLLWAHNAGFDLRFLMKHVTSFSQKSNIIECGTRLQQAHCFYKSSELVIKCSMSFINNKLSKLPSMFKDASEGLHLEKESFSHDLINENNYKSMWELSYIDSFEDKEAMIANAIKINAIKDDMIDIEKYAIHYCF